MPLATYKDLCIDAVDPELIGRFWSAVLHLDLTTRNDGIVKLTGPGSEHTVWINPVPEPVTVKQRVHVDVNARSVDEVLAHGASTLDTESFDWLVLRDPEGGELCVFERDEEPEQRIAEIVVDSHDPVAQAEWWRTVFNATIGHDEQGRWSWVEGIHGAPFRYLVFAPVPEPKTVKNRIHLDVASGDIPDLVGHGATILRDRDEEIAWTVLADPEGNEFCAFDPIRANDDVTPLHEELEDDDPLIGREEPPLRGARPFP